jgi:aminopeptidase N
MGARTWTRAAATTVVLAGLMIGMTEAGAAAPVVRATQPVAGARSLGDPLLPQLGNGGYDVTSYTIDLDYEPAANRLNSARTTILAVATQHLREFSLDFQADLTVASVTVGGKPAAFASVEATPDLSPNPAVTQPMKLVVQPHPSAWPRPGRQFKVVVEYSGVPRHIVDPDLSIEGWIQACFPLNAPRTCDGSFVVGQPMGSQSWFPSNNYPTDKASFETYITVPAGKTALGVGELENRIDNHDGTITWHWRESHPTATYLVTATVGDFLFTPGTMVEQATGRRLPVYNAIDATASPAQLAAINASLSQAPGQLNFLGSLFGRYPFDSTGAIVDRASGVGYALEVQTKPAYSGGFTSGNPSVNIGTQLHEIAHQWMGNSVTLAAWNDLWFNEGWATWSEWYWQFAERGGDDPAVIFDDLYATTPAEDWELAPAVLGGDPANLFNGFATYDRGAMTLQGYREIVGEAKFLELARTLQKRFAYSNISGEEFVDLATRISGFRGARRALLDAYFQEWLYGETRPTIVPESFLSAVTAASAAPAGARRASPSSVRAVEEGTRRSAAP